MLKFGKIRNRRVREGGAPASFRGANEMSEPGISRFSDVQLHIVVRCFASPRNDDLHCYAFTEGRCPTRTNQAAMLALAGSSGWPTWPPKSIQQYSKISASENRVPHRIPCLRSARRAIAGGSPRSS